MAGVIMGLIVAGLCGLVGWAVFSSDDESEGTGVSVATREPLDGVAPEEWRGVAAEFGDAAHGFLKQAAEEQGRLSLAGREGHVSVFDRGDHILWEARDKRGRLIDSGRIDDLGRMN